MTHKPVHTVHLPPAIYLPRGHPIREEWEADQRHAERWG